MPSSNRWAREGYVISNCLPQPTGPELAAPGAAGGRPIVTAWRGAGGRSRAADTQGPGGNRSAVHPGADTLPAPRAGRLKPADKVGRVNRRAGAKRPQPLSEPP